jgi:signal transduction histidine kinase
MHKQEQIWTDELVTRLQLIGAIFASAAGLRRVETGKSASDHRSRALMSVLSGPTAILDRSGMIVDVNDAWGRLGPAIGAHPVPWAAVGSNYLDAYRGAAAPDGWAVPEALGGIQSVLNGGEKECRLKYVSRSPNGERSVEALMVSLGQPEGGAVVSHVDITDRRRAKREMQEILETLSHRGRVVAIGELTASLAHELNQPLTAILSNVQTARRFLSTSPNSLGEVTEILADIEEDDRRAGEIIRRIRTMIRKGETHHQSVSFHDQIREVTDLFSPHARLRQVAVVLDLDPALPPVWGDRVQLSQVILNLIMNGVDAMEKLGPKERELVLRTWRYDDRSVALSIRDRGTGITTNPPDRIFEPFYTSKREGLGLGLSLSRSIVEAHGGRIWGSNNSDRGATFHLVLPIGSEESQ